MSASANQTRRARIKPGERAQKDRIGTCTQARWAPNPAAQLQLRRQQVDPIWSGRQCQSPCAARMLRCGCRVRSVPSCRLRQALNLRGAYTPSRLCGARARSPAALVVHALAPLRTL